MSKEAIEYIKSKHKCYVPHLFTPNDCAELMQSFADETNKELKKGINELEKEVLKGINELDAVKYKWPKMETKAVIKIMERMLENYLKPLNK